MRDEHLGEILGSLILPCWRKETKIALHKWRDNLGELFSEVAEAIRYASLNFEGIKVLFYGLKTEDGYKEATTDMMQLAS